MQPPTPPVALPAVAEAIPTVVAAVKEIRSLKPGYKTTEFWLTLSFNVVTSGAVILPASSQGSKIAGLIASALSLFGYATARGLAKSAL